MTTATAEPMTHSDPDGYKVVIENGKVAIHKDGKQQQQFDLAEPMDIHPTSAAAADLKKRGLNPANYFHAGTGGELVRQSARKVAEEAYHSNPENRLRKLRRQHRDALGSMTEASDKFRLGRAQEINREIEAILDAHPDIREREAKEASRVADEYFGRRS